MVSQGCLVSLAQLRRCGGAVRDLQGGIVMARGCGSRVGDGTAWAGVSRCAVVLTGVGWGVGSRPWRTGPAF